MAGQRDKAKQIAFSCPPGSLGREAIYPNFDRWYVRSIGNACAGSIGDLYERKRRELEQPATDKNIERWAEMETTYFQTQGGCTALLGSVFSGKTRAQMMKEARKARGSK